MAESSFFVASMLCISAAPFELYADPGKDWNFSQEDAERMAALGFNVVRLGVIWEGLEPGTLGRTILPSALQALPMTRISSTRRWRLPILAKVAKTVETPGQYHIYTLLDMHEDVYSSEFGGEGAPPWAVCTDSYPIRTFAGTMVEHLQRPGLDHGHQTFWTNDVVGDLQGEYIRVWKAVAHYFRDDPGSSATTPSMNRSPRPESWSARGGGSFGVPLHGSRGIRVKSSFDGSVLACPAR